MRIVSFVIATLAGLTLASCAGASNPPEGPWCAVTNNGYDNVVQNCRLPSFEACVQEVLGGNRGQCVQNPRWTPPAVNAPRRPRS